MVFVAPSVDERSYTCPHCGVLARQYKWSYGADAIASYHEGVLKGGAIRVSRCEHCSKNCIWWLESLIFPERGQAPSPNPDMPEDVKADYEEAAAIYTRSPRGAAALLRLAIQKVLPHLGGTGENINEDIAALVKKGLS